MRKLTRRITDIENTLEQVEAREEEVSHLMLETNDAGQLVDLQKELDDLTNQQKDLMTEWETLSEQVE